MRTTIVVNEVAGLRWMVGTVGGVIRVPVAVRPEPGVNRADAERWDIGTATGQAIAGFPVAPRGEGSTPAGRITGISTLRQALERVDIGAVNDSAAAVTAVWRFVLFANEWLSNAHDAAVVATASASTSAAPAGGRGGNAGNNPLLAGSTSVTSGDGDRATGSSVQTLAGVVVLEDLIAVSGLTNRPGGAPRQGIIGLQARADDDKRATFDPVTSTLRDYTACSNGHFAVGPIAKVLGRCTAALIG